jgi:Lambda phage tail tube protein, TTP
MPTQTEFLAGYKTVIGASATPSPSGSSAYSPFAGIVDVKPPAFEAEDVEVSSMDSPIDESGIPWKEYTAGWANGGEAEVKMQFQSSQNATLFGMFRVTKPFAIILSDGSYWSFTGYIKKFANEVEREKVTQIDATIKVSGIPVYTPAS